MSGDFFLGLLFGTLFGGFIGWQQGADWVRMKWRHSRERAELEAERKRLQRAVEEHRSAKVVYLPARKKGTK